MTKLEQIIFKQKEQILIANINSTKERKRVINEIITDINPELDTIITKFGFDFPETVKQILATVILDSVEQNAFNKAIDSEDNTLSAEEKQEYKNKLIDMETLEKSLEKERFFYKEESNVAEILPVKGETVTMSSEPTE